MMAAGGGGGASDDAAGEDRHTLPCPASSPDRPWSLVCDGDDGACSANSAHRTFLFKHPGYRRQSPAEHQPIERPASPR